MSFFGKDAILVPPEKKKKKEEDDFFGDDAILVQTEPSGDDFFGEDAIPVAPIETEENKGGLLASADQGVITEAELDQLAAKHKVPVSELRSVVGYMGGILDPAAREGLEHITEGLKSTAGKASEMLPFVAGLPQKAYIKSRPEHVRPALDELRSLIDHKKSTLTAVTEAASGLAVPVGGAVSKLSKLPGAAKAGVAAAEAATAGALGGYAYSGEDNELESTLIGGGLGLSLLGLGSVVGAGARKLGSTTKKTPPVSPEMQKEMTAVVEESMEPARRAMDAAADSEDALSRAVFSPEVREAVRRGDLSEALSPEDTSRIAELFPEGDVVPTRIQKAGREEEYKARRVLESEEARLRKILGASEDSLEDAVAREGVDYAKEAFNKGRLSTYLEKELDKFGEKYIGEAGGIRKGVAWFSSFPQVASAIDRRMGTDVIGTYHKINRGTNLLSGDMADVYLRQRALNKMLLKVEKKNPKFNLYEALDKGLDGNTPEEKNLIKGWRDEFERLRIKANDLGLPIQKLDGAYVPKVLLNVDDIALRMKQVADRIGFNPADEASMARILTAQDQLSQDFKKGLELGFGKEVKSVADVRDAWIRMRTRDSVEDTARTRAAASFQREGGDIPEWLLEKDATKLLPRWAANTFRHARLRAGLSELRSTVDALRKKNPDAADYLTKHIQDLSGGRTGTVDAAGKKWLRDVYVNQMEKASRYPVGSAGNIYHKQMAKLGDLIQFMSAQIYPTTLGANPYRVLENLSSVAFYGLPEVGYKQVGSFLSAAKPVIRLMQEGKLEDFLVQKGLTPKDQPFDSARLIRDGLERSPIRRFGKQAVEGLARVSMFLYQKTDQVTRGVTYFAAEDMAKKMMRGDRTALDALNKIDPNVAARLKRGIAEGKDITQPLAEYLNTFTQLNYNKASMSQFGRDMGHLFSTFSTWPTNIMGDIANRVDRAITTGKVGKEAVRAASKLVLPLALLTAVDELTSDYREENPWTSQVYGPGLVRSAPLSSALGMKLSGGPALSVAKKPVEALVSGDTEKIAAIPEAVFSQMLGLTPAGLVARLIYKDIPAYQGEDTSKVKPGSKLIEDVVDLIE